MYVQKLGSEVEGKVGVLWHTWMSTQTYFGNDVVVLQAVARAIKVECFRSVHTPGTWYPC
jgi:hypothetical protein